MQVGAGGTGAKGELPYISQYSKLEGLGQVDKAVSKLMHLHLL